MPIRDLERVKQVHLVQHRYALGTLHTVICDVFDDLLRRPVLALVSGSTRWTPRPSVYNLCAPGNRVRRSPRHVIAGKGQPLRFRYKNSNFCTLVQIFSTIVLDCGTKFVPATPVFHDSIVFPPISVSVNYLNDTAVGQNWLTL